MNTFTPYLHLIFTLFTPYSHLIYTIFTPYLHLIYTLFTPYLHLIYTLSIPCPQEMGRYEEVKARRHSAPVPGPGGQQQTGGRKWSGKCHQPLDLSQS